MRTISLTYSECDQSKPNGGFRIPICNVDEREPTNSLQVTLLSYLGYKKWTLSSTTICEIIQINGIWTILFKSDTIDKLAHVLSLRHDCTNFKEQHFDKGNPWHISLHGIKNKQEAEHVLDFLKTNSQVRQYWYVTICEDTHGIKNWTKIR